VANGAIYLIASYNFFVNRPSCYAINQQQLQWAEYVVPRVASTARLLTSLAHTESNMRTTFVLFVSSRLNMGDRLPVVTPSLRWLQHLGVIATELTTVIRMTYVSFTSFNAPYNLVRFMYEIRTASSQFLILHLIVWCALWSEKYDNFAGEKCICV